MPNKQELLGAAHKTFWVAGIALLVAVGTTTLTVLSSPAEAQSTAPTRDQVEDERPASERVTPEARNTTAESPLQEGQTTEGGAGTAEPGRSATPDIDTRARPTLDYEPSEAISEDRSVSFPVDI